MRKIPVLFGLLLGGCAGIFGASQGWNEMKLEKDLPREEAWRLVVECASVLGFPVDGRLSRADEGTLVCLWRRAPRMNMRAQRRRLMVEMPLVTGDRVTELRYRVERQLNQSMMLNPDPAEWQDAGRDPDMEQLLVRHLKVRLDPAMSDFKQDKFDRGKMLDGE